MSFYWRGFVYAAYSVVTATLHPLSIHTTALLSHAYRHSDINFWLLGNYYHTSTLSIAGLCIIISESHVIVFIAGCMQVLISQENETVGQKLAYNTMWSSPKSAAYNGELYKLKYCIEVLKSVPESQTIAHIATEGEQLQILRYLIEEGKCAPGRLKFGESILHVAALNGCLPIVEYLTKELNVNPLLEDEQQRTPLHNACRNGSIELFNYLIDQAEEKCHDLTSNILSYQTRLGSTVLHFAAASGNCDIVRHLVSRYNLDPNTSGQLGATPFLVAAQEGYVNILCYLATLDNCTCNIHCCLEKTLQNAAHIAASRGHLSVLEFCREQLKFDMDAKDCANRTPLHMACIGGHIQSVVYLTEYCKSKVLSLTERRHTPLHLAAQKGHIDIVKYLSAQKQINPLYKHLGDVTPLHFAVKSGKSDVVKFYTDDLKIALVTPDRLGDHLLLYSVHYGQLKIVKLLSSKLCRWTNSRKGLRQNQLLLKSIERGHQDILKFFLCENAYEFLPQLYDEPSLLHVAAKYGHLCIVRFLVENLEQSPTVTDKEHNTPIHRASQYGHKDIILFFLEECDLPNNNPPNQYGITPFHLAVVMGHHDIADYLIQKFGINPDCSDMFGRTALHYTALKGNLHSIKYLLSKCRTKLMFINMMISMERMFYTWQSWKDIFQSSSIW